MTTVELVLPIRHAGQNLVYAQRERFNVVACGRRWGKTTLAQDLVTDDPGYGVLDGYPCGWFAGTSKIFDEVWRLALRTLAPVIARTDTQKHRLELVTGGILDFWSLDGGDRGGAGRGRKYRRAIIDEAALVPGFMEVWSKAIRPTLVDLRGDAWFLSSTRGLQNDFYELFQRGQPGKNAMKGWKSWQMPSSANPHLSKAELEDMRGEYAGRPLDYRQEMLAEFVADQGQVFQLAWINEGTPPKKLRLYASWDLAVTDGDLERGDYSVGVVIARDAMGRWWLVDLVRGRWNSAELVERILGLSWKWKAEQTWVEGGPIGRSVEPWLRRRMQESGRMMRWELVQVTHRGDKVVRTHSLVGCMANGSFYVPSGATWIADLKDEMAAFPGGYHDDQVDALSLAFLKAQEVAESPAEALAGRGDEEQKITWKDLDPEGGTKIKRRSPWRR